MLGLLHNLALYWGLLVGDARRVREVRDGEAASIQTFVGAGLGGNEFEDDVWPLCRLDELVDLLQHYVLIANGTS